MPLTETIRALHSPESSAVTNAALKLGLLIEKARFRARGKGTLGETTAMLGDLADVELTDEQSQAVVLGLIAHLEERGPTANPTVVWALGKADDRDHLKRLERLADLILTDPRRVDLLYQLVSVLATVAPDQHRSILVRAAREAVGEARALAQDLINTHGWE